MNKKFIVLLVAVLSIALFSGVALAVKGPQGVSATVHNLSTGTPNTSGGYDVADEDEVCIFCHTPHGGSLNGALWNRPFADAYTDLTAANSYTGAPNYFTHYNSATLSPYLQGLAQTRALGTESLLCMTCHDGTIATNRVINVGNATIPGPVDPDTLIDSNTGQNENWIIANSWAGKPGAMIGTSAALLAIDPALGGDLTDDHPVSFDYDLAQQSKGASNLVAIGTVRAKGIRFFPLTATGSRMECSSCHDPHVNYGQINGQTGYGDSAYTQYAPFLVTTNIASAMCLTCHVK